MFLTVLFVILAMTGAYMGSKFHEVEFEEGDTISALVALTILIVGVILVIGCNGFIMFTLLNFIGFSFTFFESVFIAWLFRFMIKKG